MSSISSGTTTTTALVYTADTTGNLVLQTNGTTTAVTLDTSQNATFAGKVTSAGALTLASNGSTTAVTIDTSQNATFAQKITATNTIFTTGGFSGQGAYLQRNGSGGATLGTPYGTGNITFEVSGGTTAMTIDDGGRLCIGVTSASYSTNCAMNVNVDTVTSGGGAWVSKCSGTGTVFHMNFQNGNGGVGGISTNGTSTAYVTSSDRRLKTNIATLTNSGAIIDALQPRTFTWISDNSADAGFIADELQTVLPKAVTGQPNATKEEEYEITPAIKDEQGNITTPAVMGTRTVPVYQMIDASQPELIAYLVAEIQSLRARLKAANIA